MKIKKTYISSPLALICNIALAYLMYGLCRVIYLRVKMRCTSTKSL